MKQGKNIHGFLSIVLAFVLVSGSLPACGRTDLPDSSAPETTTINTTTATTATTSETTLQAMISATKTAVNTTVPVTRTPITTATSTAVSSKQAHSVIKVADYGAKGDGKTDDFSAIQKAIVAAQNAGGTVTLQFEKNATYLIKQNNTSSVAMDFSGLKNTTVQGNNATILISGFKQYLTTLGSSNLTISDLNFNYAEKVYTLSEFEEVDVENMTVTIRSQDSLGITEDWSTTFTNNFAIIKEEGPTRRYLFYHDIEVLDAAQHLYKLKIYEYDAQTKVNMEMVRDGDYQLITPIPYVGQIESSSIVAHNSENLTFKNCNIYAASYFVFSVRNNTGTVQFINTNVVPAPGSDGAMVSWRDTFHCKENRAKLIWKDCTLKGSFDDVFNISCTRNVISRVYSKEEIEITCPLLGGTYPELKAGDTITVYNHQNGRYCGRTTIKEVVRQSGSSARIKLSDKLPNLQVNNTTVAVDSLAAPNSLVENCVIEGSIRIQSNVKFVNTSFNLWAGWVMNAAYAEGTLPYDVLFKNCSLKGSTEGVFLYVGAETESGVKPKFGARNIVFEDCELNPDCLQVAAGSDVRIVENGETVKQYN